MSAGYYEIKSKLNGLVLDVEGGNSADGTHVIPWESNGGPNQIWYDDTATGTIRSKASQKCLTIENDHLIIKTFQQGNANQQWMRDGAHIRNKNDKNKVLDILGCNKEKGAKIGCYACNSGPNQSWEFKTVAKREFYIVSEMNQKVLDIAGNNASAGAKVVMYTKNSPPSNNQLWYLDPQNYVRSLLNDMAPTNGGSGQPITIQPVSNNPRSQWKLEGKKLVNGAGEAMDICRKNNDNGAEVISYSYNDSANQHWRFDFI